jgi:hypothetical protein
MSSVAVKIPPQAPINDHAQAVSKVCGWSDETVEFGMVYAWCNPIEHKLKQTCSFRAPRALRIQQASLIF